MTENDFYGIKLGEIMVINREHQKEESFL